MSLIQEKHDQNVSKQQNFQKVQLLALLAALNRNAHDHMRTWLVLLDTTAGRDKVYRTVGYTSKVIVWLLELYRPASVWIDPLNSLSKTVGTGRRMFRMFKYLNSYQTMIDKTIHNPDLFLRIATTCKALSQIYFLFYDQVFFLGGLKLISVDIDSIRMRSTWGWFLSLIFAVVADFYELLRDFGAEKQELHNLRVWENKTKTANHPEKLKSHDKLAAISKRRRILYLNFIKNLSDLVIAVEAVFNLRKISSGALNCFGCISSIVGLYLLWPDSKKKHKSDLSQLTSSSLMPRISSTALL